MRKLDKIAADRTGAISLRYVDMDGDRVVGVHRATLPPGSDLTDMPAEVQALASQEWTPERIAAALPTAPTFEQVQTGFVQMIQGRLDTFARTRNYDDIQSACSYVLSSVDKFQDEGTYAMQARDATWSAAYAILAEVQAGTRPVPTSLEDIEADLPALEWPQ